MADLRAFVLGLRPAQTGTVLAVLDPSQRSVLMGLAAKGGGPEVGAFLKSVRPDQRALVVAVLDEKQRATFAELLAEYGA